MNIQPKYSNFETDLEERHLFGKVKEFSQYRANIKSSDISQTKKPIINLKEEFTEFGSVLITEYFDNFGKTLQTTENIFDENDFILKSITTNKSFPQKMITQIERDSIKKTESRIIIINDTLKYEFQLKFGKQNRIEKQIKIEKGDTIIVSYNYKFDSNNNVIKVEEIDKNTKTVSEYKYDENGNVLESINGTDYFKIKSITKYKNNRIIEVQNYNISADLKEHLESVTEYNKYYNRKNISKLGIE